MKEKKKTVYVGLSGGVDSSVSASILKEEGYDVVGVFIDIWQPEFTECTSAEDKLDAMKVCDTLGIPFKVFDAKDRYKEKVVEYMIEEYRQGRTPNPDVMCNKYVKFGIFFDWAIENGADLVATGHYAGVERGGPKLLKGFDENKDQSYFLWAISPEKLSKTIFPVGLMKKEDVRAKASSLGLSTATKKDSQGICFLGKVDMKDFLSKYISPQKGDVLNEEGEIIGFHDGSFFYTIGQRHGFTVEKKEPESGPFYVIRKDVEKNTLTVSQNIDKNASGEVTLHSVNWIPERPIGFSEKKKFSCLTRYRQKEKECELSISKNGEVNVFFKEPVLNLTEGQSLVIYNGNRCLGGGIIDKIKK